MYDFRNPKRPFDLFDSPELPDPGKALEWIKETAVSLKAGSSDVRWHERIDALLVYETAWLQLATVVPPSQCEAFFASLLWLPELYDRMRATKLPIAPKRANTLAAKLRDELLNSASARGVSQPERRVLLRLLGKLAAGGEPGHSLVSGAMPARRNKAEAPRTFAMRLIKDFLAEFSPELMREAVASLATAAAGVDASSDSVRTTRRRGGKARHAQERP